jgi:beta-galactosidase
MEYASFEEIELPVGAVTELNPAHRMDFRRFASEQVASFNKLQSDIIRGRSPGRDIIHNFMGRTLAFDHFEVGSQLDVSSWDSYPLGFLEDRSDQGDEWKRRFVRAGDPDFQAFHHDLYRATSGGRWWVMEQQPGPVNWAPHNPAPRKGMVRLWTWEAFAHGAETVSYFR